MLETTKKPYTIIDDIDNRVILINTIYAIRVDATPTLHSVWLPQKIYWDNYIESNKKIHLKAESII